MVGGNGGKTRQERGINGPFTPLLLHRFTPITLYSCVVIPPLPLYSGVVLPPITPDLSSFYPLSHYPLLLRHFNHQNNPATLTPFYPAQLPPPPPYPHSCIELPPITPQNDVKVLRGIGLKIPPINPLILYLLWVTSFLG